MTRRNTLPPNFAGRAFAVRDARAAGATQRRLDATDLAAPVRGARVPAGGLRLHGLGAVLGTGQAFTSVTAAKLWRMPLPRRFQTDERLWVSTLSRDRSMRRPDVVASRRSAGAAMHVGGLPVLDPVRVWCSLSGLLEVHDLVAVADRIISNSPRLPALGSESELRAAVGSMRGARGVVRLRAALEEARENSWSRPETLLRVALMRSGFPDPDLNRDVALGGGRFAAPDIAWPEFRVAVEYDGVWHDDPRQRARDLERHELLADAGWLVVHIRAPDLFPNPLGAVARILRRLSERGYRHHGRIERAHLPSYLP